MTTQLKTKKMSPILWGLVTFSSITLMSVGAIAASTTADSWSATDASGAISVDFNGGQATVGFPRETFPIGANIKLWADVTTENAGFAGDYRRAGVKALDFDITSTTTATTKTRAMLRGASGRRWIRSQVAATGHNSLTFDRASWVLAWGEDDSAEAWESDLRDAVGLGLQVSRGNSLSAHNMTVSAFQLDGTQTVGATDPTLEDALFAAFGVRSLADVSGDQAAADDDADGMSNLNEILAVYQDGYFADNLFKSELSSQDGSIVVKFACVPGTYSVLRASSVNGEYEELGTVVSTETGMSQYVDTNPGEGPSFYRVILQ